MHAPDGDDVQDSDSGVHDGFSVDKTSESDNSLDGNASDELGESLGITPCNSVAHRDADLLVALTGNCSLGPVCYFCRYNLLCLCTLRYFLRFFECKRSIMLISF